MAYVTPAGISIPRASDLLSTIRTRYEAQTGLSIDWEADTILGMISTIMADVLGEVAEGVQAVYDSTRVSAATGAQFDDICAIVGISRQEATYSTATVTCTGTAGTFIPQYSQVEGGGPLGVSRWKTTVDATIGGGGTVDVIVQAVDAGAVEADAGALDAIATPISGWTSVTNADPADAGADRETDAALSLRRAAALQQAGSRSLNAIRAQLLQIDGVSAAVVIENTSDTASTVAGLTLDPHSIAVVVYPSSMTTATQELVAEAIYDTIPAGIGTNGTDVVATVMGGDGFEKEIRFDFASSLTVNVATTVTLRSGYVLADVEEPIQTAISTYMDTLTVGSPVYRLQMYAAISEVEGVASASITLNGSGSDLTPTLVQYPVLGTNTVTT